MKPGRFTPASLFSGILLMFGVLPALSSAQSLRILTNFDIRHGELPQSTLIFNAQHDLIGTTTYGGAQEYGGTVFKVSVSSGRVSEVVNFEPPKATQPYAGVVADKDGNLFGTTAVGGTYDDGTVYEVRKTESGYSPTPIFLFNFDGADGQNPLQGLIIDDDGNLFGTTYAGGTYDKGVVFELAKTSRGYAHTPKLLANFEGENGSRPYSFLLRDRRGNLFGTTYEGGALGMGTLFEIVYTDEGYSDGFKTLYSFDESHGAFPLGGLIEDARGDLLGTTSYGGAFRFGTVFKLAKTDEGFASTPKILASFDGNDGAFPYSGLLEDRQGNLFGTTAAGGTATGDGTVFKLKKTAAGYASTPTVLVSFDVANGAFPVGGLLADGLGNLFGTTVHGGTSDAGTVYEITGSGFLPKPHFAGAPGTSNCEGVSILNLTRSYGNLEMAAHTLRYSKVEELQEAVRTWCGEGK